jgi:hypothetical protein
MIVYNAKRRWFAMKGAAEQYRIREKLPPDAAINIGIADRTQLAAVLNALCEPPASPAEGATQVAAVPERVIDTPLSIPTSISRTSFGTAGRGSWPGKGNSDGCPWSFVASYIETALWSSYDDDGVPLDRHHVMSDLAAETRVRIEEDCHVFYDANHGHIHCLDAPRAREPAMAGDDFWLTRCGRRAGFWYGDSAEPHAGRLDSAARAFGNVDLMSATTASSIWKAGPTSVRASATA